MRSPPRKQSETGWLRDVWVETNRIIDYLREISPVKGNGVRFTRSPNGTMISADIPTPRIVSLEQYRIKEVFGDYLRCRAITNPNEDGTGGTEGTTDVYIAKPFRLRRDPFDQKSIAFSNDGESYTAAYSYTSNTKRTVTISGVDEEQIVVPRYKVDFDIIYAMECDNMNVSTNDDDPIDLIDMNLDARAWAGPASNV